jgi:hypothetical protein
MGKTGAFSRGFPIIICNACRTASLFFERIAHSLQESMTKSLIKLPSLHFPDAELHHRTSTEHARELIEAVGKSVPWIARKTGISERKLRYIMAGSRIDARAGKIDVTLRYTEQFTLEHLAAATQAAKD